MGSTAFSISMQTEQLDKIEKAMKKYKAGRSEIIQNAVAIYLDLCYMNTDIIRNNDWDVFRPEIHRVIRGVTPAEELAEKIETEGG